MNGWTIFYGLGTLIAAVLGNAKGTIMFGSFLIANEINQLIPEKKK